MVIAINYTSISILLFNLCVYVEVLGNQCRLVSDKVFFDILWEWMDRSIDGYSDGWMDRNDNDGDECDYNDDSSGDNKSWSWWSRWWSLTK